MHHYHFDKVQYNRPDVGNMETVNVDLDISPDRLAEVIANFIDKVRPETAALSEAGCIIDEFRFRDPEIREYCDSWRRKKGIAILAAHGVDDRERFTYFDGKSDQSVQEWMEGYDDGRILLIYVCNIRSHPITARKSLVLVPNSIYSEEMRDDGYVGLELYVPGKGYIDSMVMEAELGGLREKLEK